MPKIMFRPAPTPPPFVPPGPAPTENLIHITPYPFEEQETIQVALSNLQSLPNYTIVEFGGFSKQEDDFVIFSSIAESGEPIPTNFSVTVYYPSIDIDYFILHVIDEQSVVTNVRLNLV